MLGSSLAVVQVINVLGLSLITDSFSNCLCSFVRPSAFTLTIEASDLLTLTLTFCMCVGYDHSSHGIECQGQGPD